MLVNIFRIFLIIGILFITTGISHAKKMQEDQKSSEASMIIEEYTSSNLNRALEIVNGLLL